MQFGKSSVTGMIDAIVNRCATKTIGGNTFDASNIEAIFVWIAALLMVGMNSAIFAKVAFGGFCAPLK